uniref:SSD domain-containing protein n=1 Tax=Octactis speculum TaxID=3111310 RepID=A0A7S2G6F6_9STRA
MIGLPAFLWAGKVTENRAEKLWFPSDTQSSVDQKAYEDHFPRSGAMATLIAESKGNSGVLTKAALTDLLDIHTTIASATTSKGDTLADLCVSAYYVTGTTCYMQNILAAWSYDADTLAAEASDASVATTLNTYFSQKELETMLGKMTYEGANVSSAEALKILYFLEDDTEVIEGKYINEGNDLWEAKFLNKVWDAGSSELKYYAMASRSWGDVFSDAIGGDIVLMNIAYYIMIIYLSMNLGRLPCLPGCPNYNSRVLLAISSVLAILLSMGAAFGLCAMMGFIWSPQHGVLPFVLLGLGVDDSFVIVSAFDHTNPRDPIPLRMRNTLAHAATSITVTSLTDFVAFAISTTSAIPALSSFCMYAAVAILFLFIMQITFFASCVCFDEQRQRKKRIDCCPCFTTSCVSCCGSCCPSTLDDGYGAAEKAEEGGVEGGKQKDKGINDSSGEIDDTHGQEVPQNYISHILETKYAPFLLKPMVKPAVLFLFTLLLALCCSLGVPNLTVEDNERSFITDGSYLLETLGRDDKYFGDEGEYVYVVTKDIDYFAEQSNLAAIKSDVAGVQYLRDPYDTDSYDSWYDEYETYCASNSSMADYATDEDVFYACFRSFLESDAGIYYGADIAFVDGQDEPGVDYVVATRIKTQFKDMSVYSKGKNREDSGKVIKAMDAVRDVDWSVSAFSWSYTFSKWETYKIIQEELVTNVILCLVAVFVITTLLIGHPGCSGLVFICVAMTVLDILGCMYFWGLFIDNVSVIQTVIAIGLCVDYAAHVGHCFMLKAGTNEERVIAALADVGAAVLNGGISTFLAVSLLAGSASYVFVVLFKQFFLTVILGLVHGLILLPVLLAYVGPPCYASVEAEALKRRNKGNDESDLFSEPPIEKKNEKVVSCEPTPSGDDAKGLVTQG